MKNARSADFDRHHAPSRSLAVLPAVRKVAYLTTLAGVNADSSVWQEPLEGDLRGWLRLALRQVGSPAEAAKGATAVQSCAAVVEGVVDWKSRVLRLNGVMTEGELRHARVAVEGWVVNGDPSGIVWIAPGSGNN